MLENTFFTELRHYIFELFKNKLPINTVYHNFNHTIHVVEASNEIGLFNELTNSELEIVLIAAWFHDTGFIVSYDNHEEESKKIATNYLIEKGFSKEKIKKINSIIDATKMPQNPKNNLDEIICDADLFHLGEENFNEISNLFRSEKEYINGESFEDIEWMQKNETFLSEHKYFTNYAFEKLDKQKTLNRLKIQKGIKKTIAEKEKLTQKTTKKNEDLKRRKIKESRPEKGVETMFRVTLKNHMKLSDIADTKSNILLSVSAIILSIALSTLFPKLDKPSNAYLIYPTIFFMLFTVVTMIFSILATRPKITSKKFTKEDVKNKKVNLLFFGNFYKMKLEEFQEGMFDLMEDREYLYKSLMKDLYFLGLVLNRKYKLLRIAYNVFMIGIVISVIMFVISFVMLKQQGV